jgi:serine/threonine-protein kinase
MGLTGPVVLAADVEITPVASLGVAARRRLGARRDEFALVRPRGRAPAKLVSPGAATLLAEFRAAAPVVEVVKRIAERERRDPRALLDEAFPLLRDCFNARFLVAAGSPEAGAILPSRDRGDAIGPFEVLRCLRVVEDAELYQARGPGGIAAVKLVRPGAPASVSASLAREAAVLAHLRGRCAPKLRARGLHRRRSWLAMEWCDGGAADASLAARVVRAYAALHRAGILHGDVHPGNLLVGRRGEPMLVDFGCAVPIRGRGPVLGGRAGRGAVTAFLAPEQAAALAAGRPLPAPTERSEQYAVAVLIYLLASGAYPFEPEPGREALIRRIAAGGARPFSRAGAAPWPALEAALAPALARDPAARYADMSTLARAVSNAAPRRAAVRRTTARRTPLRRDPLAGVVDRFLARAALDAPDFAAIGPAPVCSLMLGRAGTALALLRIACAREDAGVLALADAWLTRTESLAARPDAFESPTEGLTLDELGAASPFHSAAGVHAVRSLLSAARGDGRAAAQAAERFVSASGAEPAGLDLTLGRAGTLLAAARLIEAMPQDGAFPASLPELGARTCRDIWKELDRGGEPGAGRLGHGAAHGIGGILFATFAWCRASGRPLPRGVRRELRRLAKAAAPGHEVTGWCNGDAGLVPLWLAAHARTGDPGDLARAERCAWSAWEGETPAADLCCGRVGRAYALLAFYRFSGRREWLDRARALAVAARPALEDDAGLARPLSLFKGISGLAVLAADLERPECAVMPFVEADAP